MCSSGIGDYDYAENLLSGISTISIVECNHCGFKTKCLCVEVTRTDKELNAEIIESVISSKMDVVLPDPDLQMSNKPNRLCDYRG